MYTLNFEDLYEYNAGVSGITLPVELSFGGQNVKVLAKLDTGPTYMCLSTRARRRIRAKHRERSAGRNLYSNGFLHRLRT